MPALMFRRKSLPCCPNRPCMHAHPHTHTPHTNTHHTPQTHHTQKPCTHTPHTHHHTHTYTTHTPHTHVHTHHIHHTHILHITSCTHTTHTHTHTTHTHTHTHTHHIHTTHREQGWHHLVWLPLCKKLDIRYRIFCVYFEFTHQESHLRNEPVSHCAYFEYPQPHHVRLERFTKQCLRTPLCDTLHRIRCWVRTPILFMVY